MTPLHSFAGMEPEDARRIDDACEQFEAAWAAGGRPGLEAYLKPLPPAAQRVAFRQLFRVERDQRRQRGEAPVVADYLPQFADWRPDVEELLATEDRATTAVGDEPADRAAGPPGFPEIPGYRIVREIGRGGIGVVYEAVQLFPTPDRALRTVALKTIDPHQSSLAARRRLLQEIEILARLDRSGVVRVFDVGCVGNLVFFTMDLMAGGSLRDRLGGRPIEGRPAARMLLPVVEAVAFLHAQTPAVLHLDIKPGNILLDSHGKPQLADFGLARLMPTERRDTANTRIGCTLEYAAPEQLLGRESEACDIYALGATLYEMLTGRPPFTAATAAEIISQVRERAPVRPRQLNPWVDRDLEFICLKCLEKEPRHRYASAEHLAADLTAVLEGRRPPRPGWREWLLRQAQYRTPFEHPGLWAKVALAAAAYTLLGHFLLWLLLQTSAGTAVYWLWFLGFHLAGQGMMASRLWPRWTLVPWERSVVVTWAASAAADGLLFAVFCPPLGGPPGPGEVVRVYPTWMALHGLMWVMQAPLIWGRFYLVGLAFFVGAAVLPAVPGAAPLVYGLMNGGGFAYLGRELARLARKRSPLSLE